MKRGEDGGVCSEDGVSAVTFYGWTQKFGKMDVKETQRVKRS